MRALDAGRCSIGDKRRRSDSFSDMPVGGDKGLVCGVVSELPVLLQMVCQRQKICIIAVIGWYVRGW